ncbi:efflux RND transporter permease subunit [Paracoccus onubensis]|uniref:Efflux RND transporter permease subunit n=1 Tax=Paracoccus onubensis TaxID=1675788 RepID=A0A418T0B2_9RHOB|nr:efflux RND transporter permease subunit [Paracoccus onubensis]RJE86637.1 efflux RND transporter permease subunit [Paracoccus onubensis]
MFLTRISVNNPVFTVMVMLAITVFGLFSWQRLPVEHMPDVDVPAVAIVVGYKGASPEAVENDIIKPIEDSMATISGIDVIRSTAQAGQAMVLMQFDLEISPDEAMNNVRDRMAAVQSSLPDAAETPSILKFDPSATPVISLAISSDRRSLSELTRLAEDHVLDRLRNVNGVGSVTLVGGVPPQVDVTIDPDRLAAQGIPLSEVRTAIANDAEDLPAGTITGGAQSQSIQIRSALANIDDFRDLIIGHHAGQPIHLSDVADIRIGAAEAQSLAFLNGEPALAVDVMKIQGANTIEVANGIAHAAESLGQSLLPGDVHVEVIASEAGAVEDSVGAVQNMLIEGAVLSVLIVFLFLNSWRSTVITGLALPISMIGTLVALHFLGFTLNIMTLMALSLSVGILIDDAIVVRENIARHLEAGKSHRRAALDGTAEIGLAVTATTLAIIAVFLPVAFMNGILGRFFLQFGVTVSVAVLISLFVAFTLDPMLSSVWNDPAAQPGVRRGPVGRSVAQLNRGFDRLTGCYLSILRWSLRHRLTTLIMAITLFIGSFALIPMVGAEFLPSEDNGRVSVSIEAPPGSSLNYTAARAQQIEARLREMPEVASTYTSIGTASVGSGQRNTASIGITLVPHAQRDASATEFAASLRPMLQRHAGLQTEVSAGNDLSGTGKPVQIVVLGQDSETLRRIGDRVTERLTDIPGVEDITSSMRQTQPEIGIELDRQRVSELGLTARDLSAVLQPMMIGETVATWTAPDSQSHDIVIRLGEADRSRIEALGNLPVGIDSGNGQIIRLDQVARIERRSGPDEILREQLSRRVTIEANLSPDAPGDVHAQISRLTKEMELPEGYRFSLGGDTEQMAEAGVSAVSTLLLAVICIYLVLASQFGSILQPLAIMMSLPLSLIGVIVGLWLGGSSLNVMSAIGTIMLMGLVVKNAILLVDNANQQVRRGTNLYDALMDAAHTRFRPIAMTTLAMILGMLPMALSLHQGTSQNAPMAHAVIGGLISSTVLTLVVVPVVLTYLDSLGRRVARILPEPPPDDHRHMPGRTPPADLPAEPPVAVAKANLALLPGRDRERPAAHSSQSQIDATYDRPIQKSSAG